MSRTLANLSEFIFINSENYRYALIYVGFPFGYSWYTAHITILTSCNSGKHKIRTYLPIRLVQNGAFICL